MSIDKATRDDYRELTDRLCADSPAATGLEEEAAIVIEELLSELEILDPL